MKSNHIFLYVIISIIILNPLLLALDTTIIEVKSEPAKTVSFRFLYNFGDTKGRLIVPTEKSVFEVGTDSNGFAKVSFNYSASSMIQVAIRIVPDDASYEYFENIPVGKYAYIDMTSSNPIAKLSEINPTTQTTSSEDNQDQETNQDTQDTSNEQTTDSPVNQESTGTETITENTQEQQKKPFFSTNSSVPFYKNKIFIYSFIAFVIIIFIVIIFIILMNRKKDNFYASPVEKNDKSKRKDIKLSELKDKEMAYAQRRIASAERDLIEARALLESLKTKRALIAEAERKVRDDELHLRRLRGH
jgi:large-conductance mechanosensitive channel